jgi:hypothetical protein
MHQEILARLDNLVVVTEAMVERACVSFDEDFVRKGRTADDDSLRARMRAALEAAIGMGP